ncbi:WD domain-containing protein, G-beta repeat-containing protein [Streptomyces zhaozhouensis]|uniref:WD domain-containing protein, G-beta repeat-containing protein n=1 Tax=Streptomyces zhaozhouensis TaxID=1300267 RepID=A0A286E929_9ACTN|nr:hypothetical protein [Streptomyces zhaozhouensis]SOD67364.1 WD domain-containing protein, G-beta repeat-containing protein [Streptomyces zhaozhouensis]
MGGGATVGLAVLMMRIGVSRGDAVAGVVGLFVALATALGGLARALSGEPAPPPDPREIADDLARALRAQWLAEAESRRVRDPRVLPLSWAATRRDVGADPEDAAGSPVGGRVVRLRLDGRLDGRFDEAVGGLADGYRQIASGRLVVLGEPGAGKSVLALLLTLGLLDDAHREPGGPVPVLVSASSWDPITESLDDWLVQRLAESSYAGREDIPRTLLRHGLLLPVLDGLDEIPESSRRSAVRALNHVLGQERPIVVTCRAAEYEDVIKAGSPVLGRAPVVEIAPVAAEDAIRYLADVSWPEETDWAPVYARLRAVPDGPLAAALSTPLMISMARTGYERLPGRPAELVDEERFGSRHAVEDYLTERFIHAAYASAGFPWAPPDEPGEEAARARRRLSFLALYLHRHRERDLAWWQLSGRLLSVWAAPAIGLAFGALLTMVAALVLNLSGAEGVDLVSGCALIGGCFALLTMLIWYATPNRPPGRLSFTRRGAPLRLRRGFATGFAVAAVPAAVTCGTAVLVALSNPSAEAWATVLEFVVPALAVTVIVGCGVAVHESLNAPPEHAGRADPLDSLRADRRSTLVGALAAGVVVALGTFPVLVTLRVLAALLGTAVGGWAGEPGLTDLVIYETHREAERFGHWEGGVYTTPGLLIVQYTLLPGVAAALPILLSRAWTRFALLRLVAGARGQLPWRLMRFLADAHRRGVLRQSGGQYQFRHIRLQESLVERPSGAAPPSGAFTVRPRRRVPGSARLAAGAASVALVVLLPTLLAHPDDDATATVITEFSADSLSFEGGLLVAREGERRHGWDATTGRPATGPLPDATYVDPRDRLPADFLTAVAEGGWYATLTDLRTGALLHDYARWDYEESLVSRLTLDGGEPLVLAVECANGLSYVVDARDGASFTLPSALGAKLCDEVGWASAVLSPDRTTLALWGIEGFCGVQLVDVASAKGIGRITASCPDFEWSSPGSVAFSPDSRTLATGHGDGTVRFWDARNGRSRGEPLTGHAPDAVIALLAFDEEGERLATHSPEDNTIRLWDMPAF